MAKSKLDKNQRIFVNRSLNMASIKAIGFDMDHTLAPYDRVAFETLAFRETLKKFIAAGYPEELSRVKFDPNFVIRGLLVDRERGNLLKVDAHKYVKIAFHGRQRLEKEERHRFYNAESFKAQNFLSIDTFFALSEVQLFAEIVDYMRVNPGKIQKSYKEVYDDLRRFIDLSHADGSIKNVVVKDPEKYIHKDKHRTQTLVRLIDAGKKLFLLTNSQWDYTQTVMSYLYDNAHEDFSSWRDYFEWVIVGSGKPTFFTGNAPFYEVMPESGLLKMHSGPLQAGLVYHGGNARLFQNLTSIKGDEILYAGDHIYGDIIRSKELFNWRTLLVVEEMEQELPKLEGLQPELQSIQERLSDRETLDEETQVIRSRLASDQRQIKIALKKGDKKKSEALAKKEEEYLQKLQEMDDQLVALDREIKDRLSKREEAIHPVWGDLMRVGFEKSRFAKQVEEYACIYTAKVSNLRFYSPFKRFTSPHDLMPHDL